MFRMLGQIVKDVTTAVLIRMVTFSLVYVSVATVVWSHNNPKAEIPGSLWQHSREVLKFRKLPEYQHKVIYE